MKQREMSRMQVAEMRFLRSMVGRTRRDRIRNEEIRKTIQNIESLTDKITQRRLRWYGHVKRMDKERLPRKMHEMKMVGTRPKGRPRYRYYDMIKSDITRKEGDWHDIEDRELYNNRVWWRGFVHRPG